MKFIDIDGQHVVGNDSRAEAFLQYKLPLNGGGARGPDNCYNHDGIHLKQLSIKEEAATTTLVMATACLTHPPGPLAMARPMASIRTDTLITAHPG